MSLVFYDPVRPCSCRWFWSTRQDSPISFVDLPTAKLFRQPCSRLRSSGKQDDAGHGSIQSAHRSQINIARFGVNGLDVLFGQYQQTRLVCRNTHRCQASWLDDGQQMVVFVDNGKGSIHFAIKLGISMSVSGMLLRVTAGLSTNVCYGWSCDCWTSQSSHPFRRLWLGGKRLFHWSVQ